MLINLVTRFAPSPTGILHIGNIRIALFSFLISKKNNGLFILRLDDTDICRSSQEFKNKISFFLRYLKINPDFKFSQSQNFEIYKVILKKLIKEKKAYKCFCSKKRLINLRNIQIKNKKKLSYDGFCKKTNKQDGNNFVIRLINKNNVFTEFTDILKGNLKFSDDNLDDFIIAKNNYYPTYNFASVVDDYLNSVTHIIRGEDHLSNTHKQIKIFNSINAPIPQFMHLPMILDNNKKVLSKRNKDSNIENYIRNKFSPEALLNYIFNFSLSHENKEIYSIKEMLYLLDYTSINKSPVIFDNKKLSWFNRYYFLKNRCSNILKHQNYKNILNNRYTLLPSIKTIVNILRCKNSNMFLVLEIIENLFNNNTTTEKINLNYNFRMFILDFYNILKKNNFYWNLSSIRNILNNLLLKYKLDLKNIGMVLRILLTGEKSNISVYNLIYIQGRVLILKKIIHII